MPTKIECVLTDNPIETISAKWDGERFGLIHHLKSTNLIKTTILNPAEGAELAAFIISILQPKEVK